jgi:hypothetical protein
MKNNIDFEVSLESFIFRIITKFFSLRIFVFTIAYSIPLIFFEYKLFGKLRYFFFILIILFFIVRTILESRLFINKISIMNEKIIITYYIYNKKKIIDVKKKYFSYHLKFAGSNSIVSDRLFLCTQNVIIKQFNSFGWSRKRMYELEKFFSQNNLKKTFGYKFG